MMRINPAAFILLLASAGPAIAQGGPPAVGVVAAKRTSVVEESEFVGRMQAVQRVDLVARVTGFIEKRLFVEGSEVKSGQLLYQLERGPFEAQVAAQAAAVTQAEATVQNNSLKLGRVQSLLNTPAGQRSLVDDAIAAQRTGQAQLLAAQAQLRQAQINLNYTDIKAPIDGLISRTSVTVGNVVGPSSGTLATIVSQDPMYVVFPVSVRAALDLRDKYASNGGFDAVKIKLRLPTGAMYDQTGTLNYVDNTVATTTDTLVLRGTIPNPLRPGAAAGEPGARELADGEFVTVLLQGVAPITAIGIPRAAVLSDQQGNYVWVIGDGNKAEQRRVNLGQSTPETAVITSGVKEGDMVVVDGVQRVRPGLVVSPGPASPPPTLATAPKT
ncbi:MAG: efflux RND transporter periplasmic adaptor subunit [Acetobacteraceae bacterium]|nr:efflux RND transporter periplasmic adaptor subunit [Acetobacteraceae bacterium]